MPYKNASDRQAWRRRYYKVDPAKGYVRGNVRVISWRANRLKGDATIAELERLLDYMRAEG